jgi:hypothetical protein
MDSMQTAVQTKMFQNWNGGGQTQMQTSVYSYFAMPRARTQRGALALLNTPVKLQLQEHPVLVLRSSCIPEKVYANKKVLNEKLYSHET